jgi:hypothetical protein
MMDVDDGLYWCRRYNMADRVHAQYSRAISHKWKQEVYGTSQCSKCTEREMNLQEALSETFV